MYKLIKHKDEYKDEFVEIYVYQECDGYWHDVNGYYGFTTEEFKLVEILNDNVDKSEMNFSYHCAECDVEILYSDSHDGCCNLCDQVHEIGRWIYNERTLDTSFIFYKTNNELQAILYYYNEYYKNNTSESGIIYVDNDYEYDCYHLHILDGKSLSKITEE